ncbi:MAG TPA: signal peptidase I [Candidatus Saccharimonadales bacterium]|jgi:signal peptidase
MGRLKTILTYSTGAVFIGLLAAVFVLSLPVTGWRALSVQTGSMKPAIDPGALVLVHRVPQASLAVGDVMTYTSLKDPNVTVTHRITDISPLGNGKMLYGMRGDANKVADVPVQESQIVGKVATHIPFLGRVTDFLHTIPGLILAVYIPAAIVAAFEVRLLIRRLTELEAENYRPSNFTRLPRNSYALGRAYALTHDVPRAVSHRMNALYPVVMAGVSLAALGGYVTFAALAPTPVTLRATSISTAAPDTPTVTPEPPTIKPVTPAIQAEHDEFVAKVNALLITAKEGLAADGQASTETFESQFTAATATYNTQMTAAYDAFRTEADAAATAGDHNAFIDRFNRARAEYFNALDAAKNQLAAELSNMNHEANVVKDLFMNGFNAARDKYSNDLESARNKYAETIN